MSVKPKARAERYCTFSVKPEARAERYAVRVA